MVQKLQLGARDVWLKRYERSPRPRRAMTRLWNFVAKELDAEPLRSPPRHEGEQAKLLELRRIGELSASGVRVPEVLGEGHRTLLLSDIGPSLSNRLKRAVDDSQVDRLVKKAAGEIAAVHGRGAYLGQAFPRNITVGDERIGFLDFEEDPLEVMPLRDAQARDWLLFAAGVSRHYAGRSDALAGILGGVLPQAANDVTQEVRRLAERLGFLDRCTRYLGTRARAVGVAVLSLRQSFGKLALLALLLVDYATDGDMDTFNLLWNLL
ncbi:hypothetical protein ASG87_18275 [Frateuria sp. Soil773]|uniref:hypothetical protein n=1 Tax=Frateuria sp. Soil773 TaxID=1736407 RepID=UPI0006F68393|nr:hypothetical protein [Frateuria sp. Soil773]KRE93779.1 hypothetical protein ASG87_18275 [Frateuria sp. Soil773]